jgi:hypothetical protein
MGVCHWLWVSVAADGLRFTFWLFGSFVIMMNLTGSFVLADFVGLSHQPGGLAPVLCRTASKAAEPCFLANQMIQVFKPMLLRLCCGRNFVAFADVIHT